MRAALFLTMTVLLLKSAPGAAIGCPSQDEVNAALETYITTEFWNPTERDTWKITDVSGFEFGAIKTGRIIQKQVEYGRSAEDVCPVRVEYSFVVTHADGRAETTTKGKGETHLFYLNAFDEWVFKVSSG
jgi:hypothetical protein